MANIDKLFERIEELNLTAKKVSDATGISTGNLSDWKSGRCLPSAEKLEKLADYLDCSVDYLLGRTEVPEVNRGQQHIISKNDTEFAQDITPEPPTPTLADYGKIAADGSEFTRTANIKKPKTTLYDD